MSYPQKIVDYYQHFTHFGQWPAQVPEIYTAKVGSLSAGEILQIQVKLTEQHTISAVKVQAYGCPYSIAAVAYLAEWLQGKSPAHLTPLTTSEMVVALNLPQTKLHTALLTEDLLQELLAVLRAKNI